MYYLYQQMYIIYIKILNFITSALVMGIYLGDNWFCIFC